MSDVFLNMYEKEFIKCMKFAKIIGAYQGLIKITIDHLTSDSIFTNQMMAEKLSLNLEKLKNDFKQANE